MELLIALGIGVLGYNFSSDVPTAATRAPPKARADMTTLTAKADIQKAAENATENALNPKMTGVISPLVQQRLQPFFRSSKTQNTSDGVKSRLHDLFTGTMKADTSATGTYRTKSEATPSFKPLPQQISSSGSQGNPVCTQRMPSPGIMQNNVLPTEQIRVGPGLGVGPEVSAADGFHPMLRVMPKNVGEYKLNQLEARINIGSSSSGMQRPANPNVDVKQAPRVWDMNRRPLEQTRASVTALTQRGQPPTRCSDNRHFGEQYFGGALQSTGPTPFDSSRQPTRNRSDNHAGLPITNVTGAINGIGAFATSEFDTQKFDSQQREQAGHNGTLTGNYQRHQAPSGHILPRTNREISGEHSDYVGAAGHMVPNGSARPFDATRTTLRQLAPGPDDVGAAAPVNTAPMIQCTYKQLEKEAKRPFAENYTTAPERNIEFRRANIGEADAWELAGVCKGKYIALKEGDNVSRQLSHGASSTMYSQGTMLPPAQSTNGHNRLPEGNPRGQDFGLVQSQLATNPLHVSILQK